MKLIQPYKTRGEKGSIKWILIIIVGIIVASYFFDFSVQGAIEDEQTQSNFGYIRDNAIYFYDNYIREYAEPLFQFLKKSFLSIISGESSGIENLAPSIAAE
ncbi:MAG: hypothetical protein ACI870_000185 [Crocinitomicaceae bacterium]|jgi:hypothetical protein